MPHPPLPAHPFMGWASVREDRNNTRSGARKITTALLLISNLLEPDVANNFNAHHFRYARISDRKIKIPSFPPLFPTTFAASARAAAPAASA